MYITCSSYTGQKSKVTRNSRTINPKCHTCEGKKCVHVNIYKDGAGEKSDNKKQTGKNIDRDLIAHKLKKHGEENSK